MSIIDGLKKGINTLKENRQEHLKIVNKRKDLIKNLTMPQLEEIADDYDITIFTLLDEEPRRSDFINSIAKSRLETKILEKYVKKYKRLEEKELGDPTPSKSIITHFHNKTDIKLGDGSSFLGDITNINSTIDDFRNAIINSNLDSNLIVESLKHVEEMKKEFKKPEINKSRLEEIFNWFKNNKEELSSIAMPFIHKIIGMIT